MNSVLELILDELRGAWRFRWLAVAAAWVVCILGWIVVLALPDTYQASARVFVDTRTALRPLLQGLAIDSDVDSQLNMVRQAMLGRPQLERVARETDMGLPSMTPKARAALIDKLRSRISIEGGPVSRETRESGGGLFIISYRDRSREKSLEVVDKLLNTFVEDTLGGKREGSEAAQKFLRQQIAENERRLLEAEQRLAEFKKRNVGLMPGEQGDYFSRLQNEMDAVRKAQAALNVATSRRDELQRQLRGEIPYIGAGGAQVAAGSRTATAGGDTAARIQETQARLDELLLRFTDKHPDVVATRQTLEELKQRHREEIEALRRGDPGAAVTTAATNPVYQSIQLSLNQTEVEIAALRGEIQDRQRKVAELRALVDTVPEVEAEFARLNRDYDITRANYNALVERLEKARLSEQAEERGAVRFEVIDPPSASYQPVAPNRPLLIIAVLFAGVGAGAGLAYLLHHLRPVFNSVRSLSEATGLPVLGSVTMAWMDRNKPRERSQQLAFVGATVSLFLMFVVVVLFQGTGVRLLHGVIS